MKLSKSKIDRAGVGLAKENYRDADEWIEYEYILDEYRKAHLQPLTETTLELQQWLTGYESDYYVAQRLKRKPQITRKLGRLSVRLTQLQDIGGCRIIVEKNADVDRLLNFIEQRVAEQSSLSIDKITDYRDRGRDVTGYRSLHILLSRGGYKLELQVRSRIQHYWSESIERTSVVYGHYLKESEGDPAVIGYFQRLSDAFFELESGREPSAKERLEIDELKIQSEAIIAASEKGRVLSSHVNEGIIKTLVEKETRNPNPINNWIIIFDWSTGAFVSWDIVGRSPEEAMDAYIRNENLYPVDKDFEVVLIGSSKIATVRRTHSHYFGIETYDNVLENIEESIIGFSKRMDIDVGARQILLKLHTKHFWGDKGVATSTLKNHFCQNVLTFDSSLEVLLQKGLVYQNGPNGPVSLNIKMRNEVEQYV